MDTNSLYYHHLNIGIFSYLKLPPPASEELGHEKANHEADHSRKLSNMFFRHFNKLLIPTVIEIVQPVVSHINLLILLTICGTLGHPFSI